VLDDGYPKKAIEKRFCAFLARARFHTAFLDSATQANVV